MGTAKLYGLGIFLLGLLLAVEGIVLAVAASALSDHSPVQQALFNGMWVSLCFGLASLAGGLWLFVLE